jgi:hypothetical protein
MEFCPPKEFHDRQSRSSSRERSSEPVVNVRELLRSVSRFVHPGKPFLEVGR